MVHNIFSQNPVIHRRSIRRFKDLPMKQSEINSLLEAAMSAPSADDERPWHFLVVHEALVKSHLSKIAPSALAAQGAQNVIVVCGDELLQKQQGCWILDCAAATENILVQAQILGYGAVWLGIYPVEGRIQRVRNILDIPLHIVPFAMVALGHPAECKDAMSRYDERRVHINSW